MAGFSRVQAQTQHIALKILYNTANTVRHNIGFCYDSLDIHYWYRSLSLSQRGWSYKRKELRALRGYFAPPPFGLKNKKNVLRHFHLISLLEQ